jgi:hypothetical protein
MKPVSDITVKEKVTTSGQGGWPSWDACEHGRSPGADGDVGTGSAILTARRPSDRSPGDRDGDHGR